MYFAIKLVIALYLACMPSILVGQTVLVNENVSAFDTAPLVGVSIFDTSPHFGITVLQDTEGTDDADTIFSLDEGVLDVALQSADKQVGWYSVSDGAVFTRDAIVNSSFQSLISGFPGSNVERSVNVGLGSFLLGFVVDQTGQDPSIGDDGKVYGWIEISQDQGSPLLARSAIAYDSLGIVVGTATAVPEPNALLGFLGLLYVGALRRNR